MVKLSEGVSGGTFQTGASVCGYLLRSRGREQSANDRGSGRTSVVTTSILAFEVYVPAEEGHPPTYSARDTGVLPS